MEGGIKGERLEQNWRTTTTKHIYQDLRDNSKIHIFFYCEKAGADLQEKASKGCICRFVGAVKGLVSAVGCVCMKTNPLFCF